MVTLYDAKGQKIDRGELNQEQSAPGLRSVRQVFSSYPSNALTPQRLSNIFIAADQGDPHAQCELFEDMEEKDLHLASVLGTRKRAVAGLQIKVEAPDGADAREQKAADLLEEHLANIDDLPEKLVDVLDAIGKGYSASEIIWEIYRNEAVIADIRWREPKWFRFDPESMRELRMLDTAFVSGRPLTPYKYIMHIHKAKAGIPVRGGILRPCAWMYLFKNYDFKDWITFAEVYGQPLRVGKYPTSSSEQEKDILLAAVANMGTDAAAIIPDSMLIEFVESGGKTGSADLYERLARFCDEQMSKGVLGQTSSADAQSGGIGTGQADLHGDVRDDLQQSDVRQLSGTLSRDLGRPVIDLNMGPVRRYPKIVLVIENNEDMRELAENSKTLHEMGLPISQEFLYKKFNIPRPETGEAVLPAVAARQVPPSASSDLAANAQHDAAAPAQHPADLIAAQAASEAALHMAEMLATIETMLAQADSLEQFREMLSGAYPHLASAGMADVIASAMRAADAAGRFDIEDTASRAGQ